VNRIIDALGALGEHLPKVDEETLSRYYNHLSERLSFPFTAHYPEPTTSLEDVQYRCTVLELLDPTKDICDYFDGIFCKSRKRKYEIYLPLIDLYLPEDSFSFQLIEDGSYGECETCGEQIPKPRLEAIPYAAQCIRCASQQEEDHGD
jgi:hypothetical protein